MSDLISAWINRNKSGYSKKKFYVKLIYRIISEIKRRRTGSNFRIH